MLYQEDKKFTEVFDIDDFEILTDDGWKDIKRIGKTIEYEVWEILTNNHFLKCADKHIVFKDEFEEIYVENLTIGDKIYTENGLEEVISIKNLQYFEEMYDLEVDSNEHRFYTNGILSHNTIWLGNFAANFVVGGNNTAYISCEVPKEKIVQRIGANLLDLELSYYKNISTTSLTELKTKLGSIARKNFCIPGQFYIQEFGTGQASVLDIEKWLKKTEELKGMRFKFVVVDYLNILKNFRNPNSENLYLKIKQISEDLRAMAQRNNWIVVSATQINRTNIDSTDMTLSDISESMGLVHTVDSLFGIIQDVMMHADNYYYLKILANRNGGYMNAKKRFNIRYNMMKITEDSSPIIDA